MAKDYVRRGHHQRLLKNTTREEVFGLLCANTLYPESDPMPAKEFNEKKLEDAESIGKIMERVENERLVMRVRSGVSTLK